MATKVAGVTLVMVVLAGGVLTSVPDTAYADSSYLVTSTGDGHDADPGNGACADSSGACTLRAAIEEANAQADPAVVAFFIPGPGPYVIAPSSSLPAAAYPIVLDAATQPGYSPGAPKIQLVGDHTSGAGGLIVAGGDSTIEGFDIRGFDTGIKLVGNPSLDNHGGGDVVRANFIGTDVTGTAVASNSEGINVSAPNSVIGGLGTAERNVISGNGDGVWVHSPDATGVTIEGNFIGTDVTGTVALPAGFIGDVNQGSLSGVALVGVSGATVGGTAAGARNVISGNGGAGVFLKGTDFDRAQENLIEGNYVGTDVTGARPLGNLRGVQLDAGAQGNVVGGATASARNVISGNVEQGVDIWGGGYALWAGNHIQGNYIGTDATGSAALGNDTGIEVTAYANDIGGALPGSGNVISANRKDGIDFDETPTDPTDGQVASNIIGLDATGQHPLGNGGAGIVFANGTSRVPVTGNVISANAGPGVRVRAYGGYAISTGIRVLGNRIYGNGGLGIDLDPPGVNANDADDTDTGANNLQNFPVLTGVDDREDSATVTGSLDSSAATTYRVQVFAADSCDPSGYGPGQDFVGTALVTTDGTGHGSFTLTTDPFDPTKVLTATATDPDGNTSEFSACLPIDTTPPTVSIDGANPAVLNAQTTSSSVTWHADEAGTYLVEVGGTSCGTGTAITTGDYNIADDSRTTTVAAASLAEGTNTLRICVTDTAGNTGSNTTLLTKDTVAPSVTADGVDPAPVNANASSTTVSWHATEPGSFTIETGGTACGDGTTVASGTYPSVGSDTTTTVAADDLVEGSNTLRLCVTDAAGNTGSTTTEVVKDTVAPTVTRSSMADGCDKVGNTGWCLHEQVAGFTVSDATTGVASPCTAATGTSCTYTRSTTTNGDMVTIGSGPVCDAAGNCATDTTDAGPYKIDSGAPQLDPSLPDPVLLHADVTAEPDASDPPVDGFASGLADAGCDPVDTSAVGPHNLTCWATDVAGNTTTVEVTYVVEYQIIGLLSPAPSSKWKHGQTVPIKFALADASGEQIPDADALELLDAPCRVTFSADGVQTSTASCVKYDVTKDQYVYNWKLDDSGPGAETITVAVSYPGTTTVTTKSSSIHIS
jgi:CSLREA domain-containing protein